MAGLPYNCRCFTVTGNVAPMPNPSALGGGAGAPTPNPYWYPGDVRKVVPGIAAPYIPNLTQVTTSATIPAGALLLATAAGGNGGGVPGPFTTAYNTSCGINGAYNPMSVGAGGGGGGGGGDPCMLYTKVALGVTVSTDAQGNLILSFSYLGQSAGATILIKGATGQNGTLPVATLTTCPAGGQYAPDLTPGIGGNGGYGFYTGSNGVSGILQPYTLCSSGSTANITGIQAASGGGSLFGHPQVLPTYNSCNGLPAVEGGGYGTGGYGCPNAGSPPAGPGVGGGSFVGYWVNPPADVLPLFGISP